MYLYLTFHTVKYYICRLHLKCTVFIDQVHHSHRKYLYKTKHRVFNKHNKALWEWPCICFFKKLLIILNIPRHFYSDIKLV